MSAIFIVIGASLSVAVLFLFAFIWSVNDGQYDDDCTPSIRMLFDNGLATKDETKKKTKSPLLLTAKKKVRLKKQKQICK